MKLKEIDIKNFRSIEEFKIELNDFGHKVLVGKNESGKSNILKAIAACRDQHEVSTDDLRELCEEGHTRCVFELDEKTKHDASTYYIDNKILGGNDCLVKGDQTIYDFLSSNRNANTFIYKNNLKKESFVANYIFKDKIPLDDWRKIDDVPKDDERYEQIYGKHFAYLPKISTTDREEFEQFLQPTELKDIYYAYNKDMQGYYDMPSIIFWSYKKENNLPFKINIQEFASDPGKVSKPLANMFRLHGVNIYRLKEKFEFYSQSENRLNNWLQDISRSVNDYLHERWSELKKDVKAIIELSSANDCSEIRVKISDDVNKYKFNQRSDGFRRLITFLLLVGADSKNEYLYNDIVLIDEPEICLHPSSARDLRDTLFEIGKTNYVIYATHSVSMIDTLNIENNLIVTKTEECTEYECAEEKEGFQAKSIYAALGQSVYESIKKTNVIVEGYTDSGIIKHFISKERGIAEDDLGVAFSGGGGGVFPVVSFLELGNRDYFILSDHDDSAITRRKNFEKEGPQGIWFTYRDATESTICLEDFYKTAFFKRTVTATLNPYLFSDEINTDGMPSTDRMGWLRKELHNKLDEDEYEGREVRKNTVNSILFNIKQTAFNDAKANQFNQRTYIEKSLMDKLIDFVKSKI